MDPESWSANFTKLDRDYRAWTGTVGTRRGSGWGALQSCPDRTWDACECRRYTRAEKTPIVFEFGVHVHVQSLKCEIPTRGNHDLRAAGSRVRPDMAGSAAVCGNLTDVLPRRPFPTRDKRRSLIRRPLNAVAASHFSVADTQRMPRTGTSAINKSALGQFYR